MKTQPNQNKQHIQPIYLSCNLPELTSARIVPHGLDLGGNFISCDEFIDFPIHFVGNIVVVDAVKRILAK